MKITKQQKEIIVDRIYNEQYKTYTDKFKEASKKYQEEYKKELTKYRNLIKTFKYIKKDYYSESLSIYDLKKYIKREEPSKNKIYQVLEIALFEQNNSKEKLTFDQFLNLIKSRL